MSSFFAAWQFLTVFPIPKSIQAQLTKSYTSNNTQTWSQSTLWFPSIGLFLGGFCIVLDRVLHSIFKISSPSFLIPTLIVIGLCYASGGLHLDGLSDTADGFMSSRPKTRILEIMKDSRSGPMGVLAMVSILSVKIAALSSIPSGASRTTALLLAPSLGRLSILYLMYRLPYARPDSGIATLFMQNKSKNEMLRNLLLNLGILSIISYLGMGFTGVALLAVFWLGSEWFVRLCHRKIQGFTGDTLGASCELIEALIWTVSAGGVFLL